MSFVKAAIWLRIARPISRFFAAWRVGASLYAVSLVGELCNLRFLARCLTLQDSAPRKREDYQYECGRPHDTLSFLFFTDLWLGRNQAILTQIQQADDIDMTCHISLPTKSVTWLQVMSLVLVGGSTWRIWSIQFVHFLMNIPMTTPGRCSSCSSTFTLEAWCSSTTSNKTRGSLNGNTCPYSWWRSSMCHLEYKKSQLYLRLLHTSREHQHNYFSRLTEHNNICLQEIHVNDGFQHATQVLAPRFLLYGTFIPSNANTRSSSKCIHEDLLPDVTVVTHVITCQSRDHIVNVRSGRRNPVVVSVHF